MEGNTGPLHGIGVLVTRTVARAETRTETLSSLITKHGGRAVIFPVIDIAPPADDGALRSALQQLGEVDLMIFVSVHAVHGVADALKEQRLQIPPHTRVAAVGPKTAKQCERASIEVDFVPRERINSEGLLEELSGFDAAGKNILIFRGQSGRELLKQELESRGASVRYLESYRHQIAAQPPPSVLAEWRKNEIHLAVVGSTAVMDALLQLTAPHHRTLLEATPIFAYSQRVADYCRSTGFPGKIRIAKKPTDESIVEAIIEWVALGLR